LFLRNFGHCEKLGNIGGILQIVIASRSSHAADVPSAKHDPQSVGEKKSASRIALEGRTSELPDVTGSDWQRHWQMDVLGEVRD
jgi:hypothetical protein